MNKKWTLVVLFLALSGVFVSSYLVYQHYHIKVFGLGEKSFCSFSEKIDCDVVNSSEYSEFFGVPVSGFGLLFYINLLLYCVGLISSKSPKKHNLFYCYFLSKLAFGITLIMAYLSFFELKMICLMCIAMYIINLFLVLLIPFTITNSYKEFIMMSFKYFAAIFGKHQNLGFHPHFLRHVCLSLVLFILGSLTFIQAGIAAENEKAEIEKQKQVVTTKSPDKMTMEDVLEIHFNQVPVSIDVNGRPYRGKTESKVIVAEFSDFQCPFCQVASKELKELLKPFEEQVVFYYFNLPLDQSCNPYIKRPMHQNACQASKASLCAKDQNKFWEMHDQIFDNQSKMTQENLDSYAKAIGLDMNSYQTCLQSEKINAVIKSDIELAQKIGVHGTPTVFINGRKIGSWRHKPFFEAVIKKELEK